MAVKYNAAAHYEATQAVQRLNSLLFWARSKDDVDLQNRLIPIIANVNRVLSELIEEKQ